MSRAVGSEQGRRLAPAIPLLGTAVALVSIVTGLVMGGAALAGKAFGPFASPSAVSPGLLGAAMLGVAPGLLALGRARLWEEARTLVLPLAVVLVGLFAVSLADGGSLHVAKGGNLFLVLFSLGWVFVLGVLAVAAVACLGLQLLHGGSPLTQRRVPLPGWAKPSLAVLGSSWLGIGAGLLALPGFWAAFVPWPVVRADAQALGVWALALGVGVLGSLAEDDLDRCRPALVALPGAALALGVVLAARSGSVHWASGPGLSLLALICGMLGTGAVGRVLLTRAAARPSTEGA